MKNATFRQFRALVALARFGSVQGAADALSLTSPAVSMQLRELEIAVGLPLLERSGRGVRLTGVGEHLVVHAQQVVRVLREAEDTVLRLSRAETGQLHIGAVSSSTHFISDFVARFMVEHPGIRVRLTLRDRASLIAMLWDRDVDLAVMGQPPRDLPLRAEPFAAHPHVWVAAPGHALLRRARVIPNSELDHLPMVMREPGSRMRTMLDEYLERHRIRAGQLWEFSTNEGAKEAVAARLGITLISRHTISDELALGRLVVLPVDTTPIIRRWHVVNVGARAPSPAVEAFRYFILEHGERLLARRFGAEDA